MNPKAPDQDLDDAKLEPGFSTYEAEDGWRWHYVSPHNGNILADSGEAYHNEEDCQAGLEAVKLAGAVAFAKENPPTPLEPVEFTGGVELPDPLPSMAEAARTLRDAQRAFNVADQNLNHARDDNAIRYADEYVQQRRALERAQAIIEAVGREEPDPTAIPDEVEED